MLDQQSTAELASKQSSDKTFAFHIEEFKQLREEIARLDNAKRRLEIFTIAAVAILMSWLVTNNAAISREGIAIVWWIPFVVAVLGYGLTRSYIKRCYQIGAYISRIENHYAAKDCGWECFLKLERDRSGDEISKITRAAWMAIFIILAFIAFKFCGWDSLRRFFPGV